MFEDVQDFATLNSLGTIKKITEKLPQEMQSDWVRFSYRVFKQSGKQARFPELAEFVKNETEEVGQLVAYLSSYHEKAIKTLYELA